MPPRLKQIAFLALVLIAFAFRVYRLSAQDLWGDEAFSISLSQMSIDRVVAGGADTHPPLYPVLLFGWLRLFGSTIFASRLLSAFIGVLVVPLLYAFGKRIASKRVAWFAAILASVSPLFIYYSQETRMYELVALLALASTYLAYEAISSPKRRALWLYFLTALLAIYTHYSAFYVIAAQDLFAIIALRRHRPDLLRWAAVQVALAIAYIPWFVVQTSFLQSKASARWEEFSWSGAEMIFGKSLLAFSIGLTLDPPVAWIASAFFLAMAAMGGYAILRRRTRAGLGPAQSNGGLTSPLLWMAPIYFFIPILIAFIVNPIFPFFFERYVLVALPGFYLTMAFGLDYLGRLEFRAAIGVVALFIAISLFSLTNYYFNDAYAKGMYGRMMAFITAHAESDDALVLNNPLQKPLYNYYAPANLPAFFLPDRGVPLEDPFFRDQLQQIARDHSRVWLVMFGNPAEYDPTAYLKHWLGANAFKDFARGYVDSELSLYEMPRTSTIRTPINAMLGGKIKLVSFDIDRSFINAGQTLQLTIHWQAAEKIDKPFVVFAHLIGVPNPATQSPVWAQLDNEPVGGTRATTTWKVGEIIDDRYGLQMPEDAPLGEYEIEVGMYDPESAQRVPVIDWQQYPIKENRVLLGVVRVVR